MKIREVLAALEASVMGETPGNSAWRFRLATGIFLGLLLSLIVSIAGVVVYLTLIYFDYPVQPVAFNYSGSHVMEEAICPGDPLHIVIAGEMEIPDRYFQSTIAATIIDLNDLVQADGSNRRNTVVCDFPTPPRISNYVEGETPVPFGPIFRAVDLNACRIGDLPPGRYRYVYTARHRGNVPPPGWHDDFEILPPDDARCQE